ncbi:MAG TPA: hypothetical protein VEA40_13440, partial [Ramlibacter sp.]|nr:hypothetical protein [Ramlibacter sp.]
MKPPSGGFFHAMLGAMETSSSMCRALRALPVVAALAGCASSPQEPLGADLAVTSWARSSQLAAAPRWEHFTLPGKRPVEF